MKYYWIILNSIMIPIFAGISVYSCLTTKTQVRTMNRQVKEFEREAKHQRDLIKIHVKDNKTNLNINYTYVQKNRELVNALIVTMGKKSKESIMAQGELIRILGLLPYNFPSLNPQNRNAKTIYHRFRSWQGRKGYHFCCITRGPNERGSR